VQACSLLPIDPDAVAVRELLSAFFQEGCHVDHGLPGLDAARPLLTAENLVAVSMTHQGSILCW
jgi:hypothetical protein